MADCLSLTKRIDANLGYVCNNNCLFCYFRMRKEKRSFISTAEARRLFALIRKLGINTLEITGGEATLRDDFLDLVSYAKKNLGFSRITVITNGCRFCDKAFASQAVAAGVDDVLVSLHGSQAGLHDRLVDRRGAFDQAVGAIQNVLRLGASCRVNTVINCLNFKDSSQIAGLIHGLGVRSVNYIYFSPLDDALNAQADLWVRYSDTAPFIKDMIDTYDKEFDIISIKVIPFCLLPGYERHITDFFQNIYDPYEWDYYNRVRIRRGRLLRDAASLAGVMFFMDVGRMLHIGLRRSLYEGIMRFQAFRESTKSATCKTCKFDLICPGPWKAYAARFGKEELRAVPGEKIKEPDKVLRQRFSGFTT